MGKCPNRCTNGQINCDHSIDQVWSIEPTKVVLVMRQSRWVSEWSPAHSHRCAQLPSRTLFCIVYFKLHFSCHWFRFTNANLDSVCNSSSLNTARVTNLFTLEPTDQWSFRERQVWQNLWSCSIIPKKKFQYKMLLVTSTTRIVMRWNHLRTMFSEHCSLSNKMPIRALEHYDHINQHCKLYDRCL